MCNKFSTVQLTFDRAHMGNHLPPPRPSISAKIGPPCTSIGACAIQNLSKRLSMIKGGGCIYLTAILSLLNSELAATAIAQDGKGDITAQQETEKIAGEAGIINRTD